MKITDKKYRALITGSEGFIGHHLKARLNHLDWEVVCWDMIKWSKDVKEIASYNDKVDVVFHLAGITADQNFKNNLIDSYDVNLTGTQAVLNYCKKSNAKCVFASTSGIYCESNDLIKESSPVKPSRPYSISKLLAENLCYRFSKDWNIPVISLRIFNVFGEKQSEPFIVPYLINKLINNEIIKLRMPDAVRDFIYISDVVEAMINAAKFDNKGFRIYNIGTSKPTKIIKLLHMLEEIFEKNSKINYIESNPEELSMIVCDNSKAIIELEWKLNYDLQSGLISMKTSLDQVNN